MERPPVTCPKCGQLNAGENTVCVVCQTPLRFAAMSAADAQPALAQRTAASLREHREIIALYVRWTGYAQWLLGVFPMAMCGLIFAGAMANGDLWAVCVTGPIAAAGFYVVLQAPKVKAGLIRGETWPYEIIIRMHLIVYIMLGLMMFGVLLLPGEGQKPWGALLCLEPPLVVAVIINWYAHQAFEWTIGRRDRLHLFAPLSDSGGRTIGIKAYTYLMIFLSGFVIVMIGAAVYQGSKDNSHYWLPNIGAGLLAGAPLLVIMLSLAYGVWMRRRWARLLAMGVHGLVGLTLLLVMIGLIPSSGGAGIIPGLGQFFINMAVFNWFRHHPDYFNR